MKIIVYVTPKKNVLDPQGAAVKHAMTSLGLRTQAVRIGKTIEFELDAGIDLNTPGLRQQLDSICSGLLSNPVIEDFRYEVGR